MIVRVCCGFCTDFTIGMARRGVDLGGEQASGCSDRGRAMYVSIAGLPAKTAADLSLESHMRRRGKAHPN